MEILSLDSNVASHRVLGTDARRPANLSTAVCLRETYRVAGARKSSKKISEGKWTEYARSARDLAISQAAGRINQQIIGREEPDTTPHGPEPVDRGASVDLPV